MSFEKQIAAQTRRPSPAWMLALISLVILVIGSGVWAIRAQNQVDSLEGEISQLRTSATASIFTLEPTENAPNSVQGQVFLSVSGSGAVIVSNLPLPGDNEEFRLWYLDEDDSATAGTVLSVDAFGQGFALIPGDAGNYSRIAISLETTGTEAQPGIYLMIADVRSGRG